MNEAIASHEAKPNMQFSNHSLCKDGFRETPMVQAPEPADDNPPVAAAQASWRAKRLKPGSPVASLTGIIKLRTDFVRGLGCYRSKCSYC